MKYWLVAGCTLGFLSLTGCVTVKIPDLPDVQIQQTYGILPIHQVLNEVSLEKVKVVNVQQELSGVQEDIATVTLSLSGLKDTSIRSERRIYQFNKTNNQWTKKSVQTTHQCAKGADTVTFHNKPCI